jgi:hypothetical protein
MKTLFSLLTFLIVTLSFGQNTFRTGVAALSYASLSDIIQMDDGSYIGIGYAEKDSNNVDKGDYTYLVKLNAQGQLLNAKTIGTDDGYAKGFRTIKTSDGNLAVSGILNSQMALYKFDPNLNLLWYKEYVISNSQSRATKVLQADDGGYMIAGSADQNTIDNVLLSAGIIIKTDGNGNIVWSKQYFNFDYDFNRHKYITDLVNTKDGNYAFIVQTYNAFPSNPLIIDTSYLIKIDNTGNIIWSTYILGIQTAVSLLATSDGSLVMCGYNHVSKIFTDGSPDDFTYLIKFDALGNLLWSKANASESHAFGLLEDKNGNYLLTESVYIADTHSESFGYQGQITKIDANGMSFMSAYYYNLSTQYVNQSFNNIKPTSDNGYVVAGTIYSSSDLRGNAYNDGLIFKMDSTFSYCTSAAEFFDNSNSYSTLSVSTGQKAVSLYNISSLVSNDIATLNTIGKDSSFCNAVLPLQLLSFNAVLQDKNVNIQWKTNNEINTDYFIVERSNNSNPSSLKALQKVKAEGNSSTIKTYNVIDNSPLTGTSYYRLLQADKDGRTAFSSIVSVSISPNGTITIAPNPVHNFINMRMQSSTSGKITIQITDIAGKILLTQQNSIVRGDNNIMMPASSLAKGIYMLKTMQGNSIQTIKLMKE